METNYKVESDGSISITIKFNPTGTFLEQEEQIAEAVTEAGRIASQLVLERSDTNGEPIIVDNRKYTSRGKEKKTTKHLGEK